VRLAVLAALGMSRRLAMGERRWKRRFRGV
jgi:hypothetical protein